MGIKCGPQRQENCTYGPTVIGILDDLPQPAETGSLATSMKSKHTHIWQAYMTTYMYVLFHVIPGNWEIFHILWKSRRQDESFQTWQPCLSALNHLCRCVCSRWHSSADEEVTERSKAEPQGQERLMEGSGDRPINTVICISCMHQRLQEGQKAF